MGPASSRRMRIFGAGGWDRGLPWRPLMDGRDGGGASSDEEARANDVRICLDDAEDEGGLTQTP